MLKYAIIYWSRYGNGKKAVEYLAAKLNKNGAETQILKTDDADPSAMPEADMYIFSAPIEAFNVQKNMRKFVKKMKGMDGKRYGLICTHGMDKNWLPKMEKMIVKKGMKMAAAVDIQVGKDGASGDALMEGWEAKLDEFAILLE